MLAYTTPSYDYYTSAPRAVYPLSRFVPARPSTTRERYLRAVAEAQSARETYLSELQEERFLESLRQQEALRQAEFRHQAALRQAALRQAAIRQAAFRQRQAQNFIARRRTSCANMGGCLQPSPFDSSIRPQTFPRQQRVHSAVMHQEELQAIEELLGALIGVAKREEQDLKENQAENQKHEELDRVATSQNNRTRLFDKLDAIREQAQSARSLRAQGSLPPSASSSHSLAGHVKINVTPLPVSSSPEPEVLRARNPVRDRAARTIQRRWRSHSADAAARKDALATIELLRARFHFLRNTFSFPEHLEFRTQESGREAGSEVPALSYSSANAGVHGYTNELTKLLIHADAVPSGGSKRVQDARRAFVQAVEEQLEVVEARVKKVWGKRKEDAAGTHQEAPVATTPLKGPEGPEGHVVAEESARGPEAFSETAALETSEISQATPAVIISKDQSHPHEDDSHSRQESEQITVTHPDGSCLSSPDSSGDADSTLTPPGVEEPSAIERPSALADGAGEDTVAGIPADEVDHAIHPNTFSAGPVPPLSSEDRHVDASTDLVAPLADASEPVLDNSFPPAALDLDIPTLAPEVPTVAAETFDVVYPDSRSSTPPSNPGVAHSDLNLNDGDTEIAPRAVEEGYELL